MLKVPNEKESRVEKCKGGPYYLSMTVTFPLMPALGSVITLSPAGSLQSSFIILLSHIFGSIVNIYEFHNSYGKE